MGYFSNGDEAMHYQVRYCHQCAHDESEACPLWAAHLLYNYDECNNEESILHILIPRSKDGLYNEKCRMFVTS